jgi:hypothetical protein
MRAAVARRLVASLWWSLLSAACARPVPLPMCATPAEELVRTRVPGHTVEHVTVTPARRGLHGGVTAVVASASTGNVTSVGIVHFAPEVDDYDAAFEGFRAALLKRVGPPRSVRLAGLQLEVAPATEPLPLGLEYVMWVRTHRDVAVLLMAVTEDEGIRLAAEYVRAWGASPLARRAPTAPAPRDGTPRDTSGR